MNEILNVKEAVNYDNSIVKFEYHSYSPFINSFKNNDEIRIAIQYQDIYVLPSESFIYIEGKLQCIPIRPDNMKFTNNPIAFLFEEIRYEINGVEIDRNKNVGLTSTIKNKLSLNEWESKMLLNSGWSLTNINVSSDGEFNFCIPLKYLLGFAEDYKKIIINAKHELVLIRSRTDLNAIYAKDCEATVNILKLQWHMPHVTAADKEKLSLLKITENNQPIAMAFRSWDLYEYPALPQSTRHTWAVKTVNQLEKPRFVILALQTDRKDAKEKDASKFDHCNLTDLKVYLNAEKYPYNDLNVKYNTNQYALLYEMYCKFQQSYYNRRSEPLLSREQFKNLAPLVVIDCSQQNEYLKSGPVDIRIEFQTSENIPEKTTAYCLLLHDRIVQYNPLTSEVQKL